MCIYSLLGAFSGEFHRLLAAEISEKAGLWGVDAGTEFRNDKERCDTSVAQDENVAPLVCRTLFQRDGRKIELQIPDLAVQG